jgi:hypothetical protein
VEVSGASRPTGPGAIGASSGIYHGIKVKAPKSDPKAIWDDDEVQEVVIDELDDGRVKPEYEMFVKQAVGTGDVFLGLSDKTPGSQDCETLVITINVPGTQRVAELDVDVQTSYLRVTSATYKLGTFLPHKVDEKKGKCLFISDKAQLRLELPILRDLDDMLRGMPGM